MNKKYIVRLSDEERASCQVVIKKLKGSSQKVRRAHILLKADADGPAWTDTRIAEAFQCRVQTIENLRKRVLTESFELALDGQKREKPPTPPKLDGEGEAKLIAMRLGQPPQGIRQMDIATAGGPTCTIGGGRFHLSRNRPSDAKKNRMTKRMIDYWVIPPENDAEFVAGMEEVLETYERPYDAKHPVICMDEQPVQLLKETKQPIPATQEHPQRVDYEYERNGTASIFMFTEPLSGFRQATARPQRTKVDWAQEVARLLDTRYAHCERVTLVLDNLNTHTKGAFYEVFEPALARAYVKRIEFIHTPKHGSWLNVAECELSAMTRQCLSDRRIGELHELNDEIAAWSSHVNQKQRGVDWQFQIGEARTKLARLYPKIKTG